MGKLRAFLAGNVPEIYFILSGIYYWTLSGGTLIAGIVISLFVLQIFTKNRITGGILSILMFLVNFYLVFALLSEFNEFPAITAGARNLLLGGSLYIIFNIFMSMVMLVKYTKPVSPEASEV